MDSKTQKFILEDFLNSWLLEGSRLDRIRKDHVLLEKPLDGPNSAEMVKMHWRFIMGYYASFDGCFIPTLKSHAAVLRLLAKRYLLLGQKARAGAIRDWADREAPVMRCAVVHALELTKRTPKAKCPVIANVKNFLLNLIHQSGGKDAESALAAALDQDLEESTSPSPLSRTCTPASAISLQSTPAGGQPSSSAKTATSPDEMDTLPMDTLQLELETELCKQLENIMIDVDAVKGSNSLEASDPGHRRQADKDRQPVQPVPPEVDADMEKDAQDQFEQTFPDADTEMDVHAAQLKANKAKKVSDAQRLVEKARADAKVVKLIGKKPGGARGRGKGRGRGRGKVAPPPTVPPNGFEGSDHEEEPEEPEIKDEVPKNKPKGKEEPEPEIKDEVSKNKPKGKGTTTDDSSLMARWKEVEPEIRAAEIPVPDGASSKKSYTLKAPSEEASSLGILWFVRQIYVSVADPKAAELAEMRINQKGGVTLSPIKLGGWDKAFDLARKLGSWPKNQAKQSKKSTA